MVSVSQAFLGLIAFYIVNCYADCDLGSKDIKEKSPIVLKVNFGSSEELLKSIYLPNGPKITIKEGAKVHMSCSGTEMHISGKKLRDNSGEFTCKNGKFGGSFFFDIQCKETPKSAILRDGTKFKVIFNVSRNFLRVYSGEIDDAIKITKYIKHVVPKQIMDLPIPTSYSYFHDLSNGLDEHCKSYYTFENQVNTFKRLFGNSFQNNVGNYFDKRSKYLARGHLVPHRDFNFPYTQKSTYYFDNVVPQWQQINNGNWKRLEKDIRDLASRSGPLTVYSGTHEISRLFGTDLYLCVSGTRKYIPVPKFMWKVVLDTRSGKAVAFVMSNNPNDRNESLSFYCPDVCSSLTFISIRDYNSTIDSFKRGYLYCCEVTTTLLNSIRNIPVSPMPLLT